MLVRTFAHCQIIQRISEPFSEEDAYWSQSPSLDCSFALLGDVLLANLLEEYAWSWGSTPKLQRGTPKKLPADPTTPEWVKNRSKTSRLESLFHSLLL